MNKPSVDLSGLDGLSFGDLMTSEPAAAAAPAASGTPLEMDVAIIDEDPGQPRTEQNPGFAPEQIAEIGASIKARGVKTPISVRENPDKPGHYLINHGARRFRGTKWAEKTTIPVIIDNDYNEDDQVIENIQRENLTPMEIAIFIGKQEAKGLKAGEIAGRIGKKAAFVSKHKALLAMPDFMTSLYDQGFTNVECLYELSKAFKKFPEEIERYVDNQGLDITLAKTRVFLGRLDAPTPPANQPPTEGEQEPEQAAAVPNQGKGDDQGKQPEQPERSGSEGSQADPNKIKKAIVQIQHDDRPARILLDRRAAYGLAWIKYDDDGHELEIDLATAALVAIVEGA